MSEQKGGKSKLSGEKLMRKNGRTKVVVWLDHNEADLIFPAAARSGARVSTWIRQQAYHAAEKSEQARRLAGR